MRFWIFLFGLVLGLCAGILFKPDTQSQFDMCVDELIACQESLADPHHCVSVVVEELEAQDGK